MSAYVLFRFIKPVEKNEIKGDVCRAFYGVLK